MRKTWFGLHPKRRVFSLIASAKASRRDALRLAVQTAAASAAAYLAMSILGLPHVTWAVIAALFTIHPLADSSLRSALDRWLGAMLGVGIGLLAILMVGGEDFFLARLVIAAAVGGAIMAVWPALNYVGVLAVVMAMQPDPELVDALARALAIVIGAAAATASTLLLWPKFGVSRTVEFIEDALAHVRDLFDLILRSIDAEERRERDELHAAFLSRLETARETVAQSWFGLRLTDGTDLRDALRALEGLWHGLVILDRVVTDERVSLDQPVMTAIRPDIEEVRRVACEFTDGLIKSLRGQRPSWPRPGLKEVVGRARDAASNFLMDNDRVEDARSRSVHALIFALDEVERNLEEVASLIAPAELETSP